MRFATNSVTTGNRSVVLDICTFLRGVYAEYQRLASVLTGPGMGGGAYKELPKKMEVWMQSLVKIETRSYRRRSGAAGARVEGAGAESVRLLDVALIASFASSFSVPPCFSCLQASYSRCRDLRRKDAVGHAGARNVRWRGRRRRRIRWWRRWRRRRVRACSSPPGRDCPATFCACPSSIVPRAIVFPNTRSRKTSNFFDVRTKHRARAAPRIKTRDAMKVEQQ